MRRDDTDSWNWRNRGSKHLELLELEKQKLQAETRRQEEREKSRREEDARRQHERELDRKLREAPPLKRMSESTDAELFLAEFEARMTDLEIPRHRWMTSLRPLLAEWLQDVLDPLPQEERSVYATAKAEIMSAYSLRYGSLGHRLVMQERPKGMSGSQRLSQIVRRWKQWTTDWDCNEIANQYAIEYGLKGLPYACRNFCQEQRPKSARELGGIIDKFFSDRDSHIDDGKWYQKRTRRAPLMPLPTIEEPFRRLAMDIVGPLRKTKRGHKFILTIMDFATRYPEAIPLRRIDAAAVAEALCGVFTRLGIPEEILSDGVKLHVGTTQQSRGALTDSSPEDIPLSPPD